ncbi:hypothetical protein BAMA_15475 [Bacillus manliponensis]|uniref:Fibronectin type-III domain-containing protein n=1 Tax=Bacillus manliponensis TaxID=574376 RepID=A0A073JSS2_9BACI|nr:hypothetical protein [Bacillus manliponensis]KEK17355.1 hypothetical protein BAMA_15475 [Bacillus manliponensis]
MRKYFIVSLLSAFLFSLSLIFIDSNEVQAATLGQQLSQPEEDWKRYEDDSSEIEYKGTGWERHPGYTTGQTKKDYSGSVRFVFYGTKLRVLSYSNDSDFHGTSFASSVEIKIDGVAENYRNDIVGRQYQTLVYEKQGLEKGYHVVEIKTIKPRSRGLNIDAIDVDSDGYLVPIGTEIPNEIESPVLEGAVTEEGHALTWKAIEGAKGYNVKRALNAGGPYETIASDVTTNSFVDKDIKKGTKYFYVVTTVMNEGESKVSNEVTLTSEENSNVTLTLHLSNNHIKEYDITKAEFEKFLDWFDKRMNGEGKAYYVFEKKVDGKPYHTIKEYIVYDQIVWFETKEY